MSMTFICPEPIMAQANKLVQLLDPSYGPTNFSIPLSKTGEEPATYYGGHLAGGASPEFLQIIADASQGKVPVLNNASDLGDPIDLETELGVNPLTIFAQFTIEMNMSFNDVLTKHNLQRITVDEI